MQDELRKAAEHMQRMSQVQQQESAWRSSDEKVSLLDLKDEATVVVGGVDKYAVGTSLVFQYNCCVPCWLFISHCKICANCCFNIFRRFNLVASFTQQGLIAHKTNMPLGQ